MIERWQDITGDEYFRPYLGFFAILAVLLVFYAETLGSLLAEWTDNGSYSHGLLAVAVSAYLLWQERATLASPADRPYWPALVLAFGFGGLWLIGSIGNVLVVQQVAFICVLNLVVLAMYGPRQYRKIAFPLLTLLLVTPMWQYLAGPLRDLSTVATHTALKVLGLPVLLEGYDVTVPGGRFVIELACSGLGFFLCSGLIGAYFAYFNRLNLKWMFGFVTLGLALAIVANWLRIIVIILVGNATQMQHFIVTDHLTFGWLLFSAMLIPYFVAGNYIVHRHLSQHAAGSVH